MKELALHLLDLTENAIAADATEIRIGIRDSLSDNDFRFSIEDNGRGMAPDILARAADPYTTTRTTRKIGLGLSLVQMNTERCGGGMRLASELGRGTALEYWFRHDHWDRPPMGDLAGTLALLMAQHECIRFAIRYSTDEGEYTLCTDEVKAALGDMPMNNFGIIRMIREMVSENLKKIGANE